METHQNRPTVKAAKKLIAEKCKDFEARLLNAKNAFYMVQVLNEMEELLDAEVIHWQAMIADCEDPTSPDAKPLLDEASVHIGNMIELIEKFNGTRRALMPEALKIQQAMINSHELQNEVLHGVE